MSDDILGKFSPSRREFIKTLVSGAAFATPMLLSFSMNGPTLASNAYGGSSMSPNSLCMSPNSLCMSPNSLCSDATASNATSMIGSGAWWQAGRTICFTLVLCATATSRGNALDVSWRDSTGHAHKFTLRSLTSLIYVSCPGGGTEAQGSGVGTIDGQSATIDFDFTTPNSGDIELTTDGSAPAIGLSVSGKFTLGLILAL